MSSEKKTELADKLTEWLLILAITGVIGTIGNCVGYSVPIMESIPGVFIIFLVAALGMLLAELVPLKISSIIYVTVIGMFIGSDAFPFHEAVNLYVGRINQLALSTVCLGFAGVGIAKDWDSFKKVGLKGVVVSCFVIFGTYIGTAILAHLVMRAQGLI